MASVQGRKILECYERTDQLYLEPATQKVFLCYCLRIGLPRQYHSDVWAFWKNIVDQWPCLVEGNLLNWFCVIIYKFLTTRTKLLTDDEVNCTSTLTVYHLCHYACMTLPSFLNLLNSLESCIHGEPSPRSIALQQKVCIDVAIAKKHFALCNCIFIEEQPSLVTSKRLPWLLFVVAKLLKIGNASQMVDYYILYLCSLCNAISLSDLDSLMEPFGSIVSVSCDADASVLEYICIKLNLPLKKFMTFYQMNWIPFRRFLQQVCHFSKNDLLNYLRSKYEDAFSKESDLHELLFLDETNTVIYPSSATSLGLPPSTKLSETRILNCNFLSVSHVNESCNSLTMSPQLKKHLENSVKYNEKKFNSRQTFLQSWFIDYSVQKLDLMTNLATTLCVAVTKLYLFKLENILYCENKRILQQDFSNLLLIGTFHKSLFAVCTFVILINENVVHDRDKMLMVSIAKSLETNTLNIHMILETFVLHEPFLSREMHTKILEIEEQLLTQTIWEEEVVYDWLSQASLCANEVIKMTPDYYCDAYYDDLVASANTKYLIRRLRRVMQNRLLMICDALGFDDKQFLTTWPCLEYSILFLKDLTFQRHLDQLLLCSVYSVAKILEKEVQFRAIIESYRNLKLGPEQVYKNVRIKDGIVDSVIFFYNTVYMDAMKDFLLHHGVRLQNSLKNLMKPTPYGLIRLVQAKYLKKTTTASSCRSSHTPRKPLEIKTTTKLH